MNGCEVGHILLAVTVRPVAEAQPRSAWGLELSASPHEVARHTQRGDPF